MNDKGRELAELKTGVNWIYARWRPLTKNSLMGNLVLASERAVEDFPKGT
jgi:hypothetical protein